MNARAVENRCGKVGGFAQGVRGVEGMKEFQR